MGGSHHVRMGLVSKRAECRWVTKTISLKATRLKRLLKLQSHRCPQLILDIMLKIVHIKFTAQVEVKYKLELRIVNFHKQSFDYARLKVPFQISVVVH